MGSEAVAVGRCERVNAEKEGFRLGRGIGIAVGVAVAVAGGVGATSFSWGADDSGAVVSTDREGSAVEAGGPGSGVVCVGGWGV